MESRPDPEVVIAKRPSALPLTSPTLQTQSPQNFLHKSISVESLHSFGSNSFDDDKLSPKLTPPVPDDSQPHKLPHTPS
ncbi:hypothetical protein BLNAU_2739 [Blattamonas nauphoetae]|uniref:Uncharacterized protein n=1 Tax=Blattamonas nauphoetae TaxID=2049346 RepID=A0ABQ9YED6_9EUKA|nr:hypothetical protein BLNAU_2739 [Blattamonas nauphoetae]